MVSAGLVALASPLVTNTCEGVDVSCVFLDGEAGEPKVKKQFSVLS